MNVALLSLVPLALLGFAAGAFVEAWLRAVQVAMPVVAPASWIALPPLLLGAGAGAWLGGRVAARSSRPLGLSSLWAAVAAVGAMLAPRLLELLADGAAPDGGRVASAGGRVAIASWYLPLPFAVACGGALVLLVGARTRVLRSTTTALLSGLALPALAFCLALWIAPGLSGETPTQQLLPAVLAVAAAGLLSRALTAFAPEAAPWRVAPDEPGLLIDLALATLQVAAGGALLATVTLVVGRIAPAPSVGVALAAGVLAGLAVQVVARELLAAWLGDAAPRVAPPSLRAAVRLLLLAAAVVVLLRGLARPGDSGLSLAAACVAVATVLAVDLALRSVPVAGAGGRPPAAWFGRHVLALAAGASVALLAFVSACGDGEPPRAAAVLRPALQAACAAALLAALATRTARARTGLAARWSIVVLAGLALTAATALTDEQILPRAALGEGTVLASEEGLRHEDVLVGLESQRAVVRRDGLPLVEEEIGSLQARRIGRLAAALAPEAHDAAVLLRDGGHALATFASTTAAKVTCVEPDAALVVLQPDIAWEAGQDGRGGPPRLVVEDPRAFLLGHPGTFDLVLANVFRPDEPGAEAWLTAEHFLALRGALRPEGVAVLALPLSLLPWPAFERAGAAFLQAFPDSRLLVVSLRADAPVALLAGGLSRGLPGSKALDELLGASPAVAGPNGAPDVYDLYVCDGWTLAARWRDLQPATLAQPLAAWLSNGRADDAPVLGRIALRQLADLAVPLDTSSLQARPVNDKEDRRLGTELTARSAALVGLLTARSARLQLGEAAPGQRSADDQLELDDRLDNALLFAWRAAAGHLDVRDALLERAGQLAKGGRVDAAAALLDRAVQVLSDPHLAAVLGGLLLQRGQTEEALTLLREARSKAPDDRGLLLSLAAALVLTGDETAGRGALESAASKAPLPPAPTAVLALLRGDATALAPARSVLDQLPAGDPWALVLRRLLRLPEAGG